MNKNLRICLMWHNLSSANYGVGALTIAHLGMIVSAAKTNGVSISIDTVGTAGVENLSIKNDLERRLGVRISHIEFGLRDIAKKIFSFRWNQINFLRHHQYDLMFDIGEGDSFSDIYGLKRFFLFSLSKWYAIRKGLPLIIAPQTIGPFKHSFASDLAGYLMRKSMAVYVRDDKSSDFLHAVKVKHTEVSDVAFLLPYDSLPKIDNSIGINVSALLWYGGYTKNNQFELSVDYKKLIIDLVNEFLLRSKSVYLISHVITDEYEVEDDYRVSKLIKNNCFREYSNVAIAPKFNSPIEAKSYISQMHFFIGSRMHATIGALSSGVVTIPLAYSRKFTGVFGSIDYPYTIDPFGDCNNQTVINEALDYYDNHYDEMQVRVKHAIFNAKQKLNQYSDFLSDIVK